MDRRFFRWSTVGAVAIAALFAAELLVAASCSVYMESTRPTPVDLSQFGPGQTRDSVLERLGSPEQTVAESDGASCDIYALYTHGYGAGGKIPIAIAEGAADVVTLGLAEVILTPTEGVTANEKHPVAFCYRNQKIVRIVGGGASPTDEASAAAAAETVRVQSPSPSPAAQLSPVVEASPAAALSPVAAASPAAAPSAAALAPEPAARPAAAASPAPAKPPPAASTGKAG
jgi:hypothetical protein